MDASAGAAAMSVDGPPPPERPAAGAVARAASASVSAAADVKSGPLVPGATAPSPAAAAGSAAKPAGTLFYYRSSPSAPLVPCRSGPLDLLEGAGFTFAGLQVYEAAASLLADKDEPADPGFDPVGDGDPQDTDEEAEDADLSATLPALPPSDDDDGPGAAVAASDGPGSAAAAADAGGDGYDTDFDDAAVMASAQADMPLAAPPSDGSALDLKAGQVLADQRRSLPLAPRAAGAAPVRDVPFGQRFDRQPRAHGPITIRLERFRAKAETFDRERPVSAYGIVEPISTAGRDAAPEPVAGFRVSMSESGAKRRAPRNQGRTDVQKGHIWALNNGGPDVEQNITPQWAQWQANGAWKRMEAELHQLALEVGERGNLLFARITVNYPALADDDGATFRALTFPCSFAVVAYEVDAATRQAVRGGAQYQKQLDARQDRTDRRMFYRAEHADMGAESVHDARGLGLDKKRKRQKVKAGDVASGAAAPAAAPAAAAGVAAAAPAGVAPMAESDAAAAPAPSGGGLIPFTAAPPPVSPAAGPAAADKSMPMSDA